MEGLRKEPPNPAQLRTTQKRGLPVFWQLIIAAGLIVFSFALGFVARENNWISPYTVANSSNEGLPEDLNYESVEEVYDVLRRQFDGELSEAALIDGMKHGLVDASGDEYTTYFNAEQTETFFSSLNGSFEGIGAELGIENDVLIVVAPLSGFPAEKAGLRAGDIIAKIDGEDSLKISVEEAVTKIRGEKGTDVTLTIIRGGEEQDITITRDTIVVPSVEYEVLDSGIGYIFVSRFAEDTSKLILDAADDLKATGVRGIILDLRNNTGGYVDAGVNVASLWLNSGDVVFEQRTGGETRAVERATGTNTLAGIDTIVLINEGSASASEIVAGALKDHGVAQLLGKQSYGKGSVQRLEKLTDGSTLKVTVARWFTPNGVNIDEEGITPDIEVELTQEDYEADRDPQLDRAVEILTQN